MPDELKDQPAEAKLSSIEGNLFAALFNFSDKTMKLARQSSLDDDKLKLVAERIKRLLGDTTAEISRTNDFSNLAHRLDSTYAEVKRLVDEWSDPHLDVACRARFAPKVIDTCVENSST